MGHDELGLIGSMYLPQPFHFQSGFLLIPVVNRVKAVLQLRLLP